MVRRWLTAGVLVASMTVLSPVAFAQAAPKGDHNWCVTSSVTTAVARDVAQCQAPEAPFPIGLPLAGVAVAGGFIVLVRRRSAIAGLR